MSVKDNVLIQKQLAYQRSLRALDSPQSGGDTLEMSDKVHTLAREIYAQFEKLIKKYDQHVVEELMPLVVSVLEILESTHQENEEHKAELEILREDNEQLLTQYEREKEHRKQLDKKTIEIEDSIEEEKRKQQDKMESLEALVRVLEMKAKNASDQVARLEEKERESRKEFDKLHERYTQLFKSHADHIERTRILLGSVDNLAEPESNFPGTTKGNVEFQDLDDAALLQRSADVIQAIEERARGSSRQSREVPSVAQISAANYSDMNLDQEDMEPDDVIEKHAESMSDNEDEPASDRSRHPDDQDASGGRFPFGISREVEKLIMENNELLAVKNALNVVKDDLIAQVDELTSEKEMMRDEIKSLQDVKGKLQERIVFLEGNLRRLREYYESKLAEATKEEENLPNDQQKRFTRQEMSRLVMEKNKYKEQLMELQDQLRLKEISMQVPRRSSRSRSGLWKFFGNLFGSSGSRDSSNVRYHDTSSPATSAASRSPPPLPDNIESPTQIMDLQESLNSSPRSSTTGSPARPKSASKSGSGGRVQAYGWSIPADAPKTSTVPYPIYCRPLPEKDPDMKIWCAVSVPRKQEEVSAESHASSAFVWICSSTHSAGKVSIIDANKPNDVLESFSVCSSHLLCIAYIKATDSSDLTSNALSEQRLQTVAAQKAVKNGAAQAPDLGELILVESSSGQLAPPDIDQILNDSELSASPELQDESEQRHGTPFAEETVWVGSEKGGLYVYAADREIQKRRLWKITLGGAVLSISQLNGNVFASLADGTVAVFSRARNGAWDTVNYWLLNLGKPDHAVRAMVTVRDESVWCACRNKVHIVDPVSLKIQASFDAHSKIDSQIRQMVNVGQGVWISIRLDNTIRLFHALTHQHLQDLHIEPLAALINGQRRLGLSLVRITAMAVSSHRLWIGTSTGVIISAPFTAGPESAALVTSSSNPDPEDLVPFCNANLAQVSFHGHNEEVKFFISIPGVFESRASSAISQKETLKRFSNGSMLMSGGQGYIDFRYADDADIVAQEDAANRAGESSNQQMQRKNRSFLTVWQIPNDAN